MIVMFATKIFACEESSCSFSTDYAGYNLQSGNDFQSLPILLIKLNPII